MSSSPRLLLALVCLSLSAWAADISTLNIPLDFEKNEGQLSPKVHFSVHSEQGVFFLTRDGIALEPNGWLAHLYAFCKGGDSCSLHGRF